MNNAESKNTPVCLTIAGLDPSGGAGIAADIKTFSALGCYAAAAITSVTFQNTCGVFGAQDQTANSVRNQIEPVFDDFEIAALKTGMLPTIEIIEEIAVVLKKRKARNVVVDPVVRSTSGFDLIDDAALQGLIKSMFPLADIVTPNLLEAERIAGMTIRCDSDYLEAARKMIGYGAKSVLIKGGHTENETRPSLATDRFFDESGERRFEAEYIDTTSTHGTGCTLSAAIAASLGLGYGIEKSIERAKLYVTEAIRCAEGIGKGNSPVNHWAGVKIWGER